jgi:hypothetical protein
MRSLSSWCCPHGHAPALAVDNVLLIQLQPGGAYRVWHTEGESQLTDDEVMALEATARPGGGEEMATGAGPARAHETSRWRDDQPVRGPQ